MGRLVRRARRGGARWRQSGGAVQDCSASNGSVTAGGGSNPVSGYSLISAKDIDAATALAKGCPILAVGGSVEVVEAVEM